MESFEPKKLSLIRILQILWKHTDSDHPLTHGEIVKKLESDYDITVERKVTYNKYGADKKLHYAAVHVASPYQMILHNQRYFLMCFEEKWKNIRYFRLDRITNIELSENIATNIRTIYGYKNGIDYKRFSSALPYMFSDEPEQITFTINGEWMIDQIVDWFGYDFNALQKDGDYIITVKASPNAMEYWAMQYLNNVEILSPAHLREQIAKNVAAANKKYDKKIYP